MGKGRVHNTHADTPHNISRIAMNRHANDATSIVKRNSDVLPYRMMGHVLHQRVGFPWRYYTKVYRKMAQKSHHHHPKV